MRNARLSTYQSGAHLYRDSVVAACLIVFLTGCGSTGAWVRSKGYHSVVPLVFSEQDIVGKGVIRTPDGFVTRPCLKKFDTRLSVGDVEIELRIPALDSGHTDVRIEQLIDAVVKRAARRPPPSLPPRSVLLVVRAPRQRVEVIQASVDFTNDIEKLIDEGDEVRFFAQCGSEFVLGADYASASYALITFWPDSVEQDVRVARLVESVKSRPVTDVLGLAHLRQLRNIPTAIAMYLDSSKVAPLIEMPLSTDEAGIQAVTTMMVSAARTSGRGQVLGVRTMPWRTLPFAQRMVPSRKSDPRPQSQKEFVEARVELLKRSVQRYWLRLWQSGFLARRQEIAAAPECMQLLAFLRRDLGPEKVDACAAQARHRLVAAVELLPRCKRLVSALERLSSSSACRVVEVVAKGLRHPLLLDSTFSPLELKVEGLEDDFSAVWERGDAPPSVTVGSGADRFGKVDYARCIASSSERSRQAPGSSQERPPSVSTQNLPEELRALTGGASGGTKGALVPWRQWDQAEWDDLPNEPIEGGEPLPQQSTEGQEDSLSPPADEAAPARTGIFAARSAFAPYGKRFWPWWKRWLYFWKQPPVERDIYRGVLEASVLSEALKASFQLTDKAKEQAMDDLDGFFQLCGTHYVAQVEYRRGVVYYLAPQSPHQREVSLLPYGVSRSTAMSPAMQPRSIPALVSGSKSIAENLNDAEGGLPVRLRLEPWINYLRTHGLVAR